MVCFVHEEIASKNSGAGSVRGSERVGSRGVGVRGEEQPGGRQERTRGCLHPFTNFQKEKSLSLYAFHPWLHSAPSFLDI